MSVSMVDLSATAPDSIYLVVPVSSVDIFISLAARCSCILPGIDRSEISHHDIRFMGCWFSLEITTHVAS